MVPTEPIGTQIFSSVVDLTLWVAVYIAHAGIPQSRYGLAFRAKLKADRFLSQWNYDTIKRAIAHARQKKLLQPVIKGRHTLPEITQAGIRRLTQLLPRYHPKRTWDGRMHLITYDIPEKQQGDRSALRDVIKKIGAAHLQDSVWITPYNPIDTLRLFITDHNLSSTVIVSDMGKDGAIGEEDIKSLVVRLWRLDILNKRYTQWLTQAKRSKHVDSWMTMAYLSILKDDPQLPFPLLPSWWKGDEAYQHISSTLGLIQI